MKQDSVTSPSQCSGAFLAALIGSFLVGCAGASTQVGPQYSKAKSLPRPPVVLVYQFAVDAVVAPSR